MADDSLEVQEELDFHSCNIPYGMIPFVFEDVTHDQQKLLNHLKIETIRSDEIYLARHPQVRAIVNIILRRVFRVRPKRDIRLFIAKYFLRSYEDIKAEVTEVMRPRKDHVYEGDSAVCLAKRMEKTGKKKGRSREVVSSQSLGDRPVVSGEVVEEDPTVIIKAIIEDILCHLERVCMKDMNIIFSDDEDDILSDYNYRESGLPVARSISEELSRIEQEEEMARRQELGMAPDDDAIRKYLEAAHYTESEFYGETYKEEEDETIEGAREPESVTSWKPTDVYVETDDVEEMQHASQATEGTYQEPFSFDEKDSKYIKEKETEIDEIDYDETRRSDEEDVDQVAAGEVATGEVIEYDAAVSPDGEESEVKDEGVVEIPDKGETQEVVEVGEAVTELTEQGERTTSAPLVVKDSAEQEKDMEEYFLAPIEDTVPTYLQADDDTEEWSPTSPEAKGTGMAKLPTMRKTSQTVIRSLSITPGEAKGSRVQLVIDKDGEVHDHKPQAWDFAEKGGSGSKTKLLPTTEKSKSVTLVKTGSRHDRSRTEVKK